MIVLRRENFKEVMSIVFNYVGEMNMGECTLISSSDTKREIMARNDLGKLLDILVEKGVNIEEELNELAKEYGINLKNGDDFVQKDDEFEIKFKSHLFDKYLSKNYPELLIEDEVIIKNKEFCRDLDIGNSRFSYQLWDTTDKAIEYLKSNCSVFASASEILDKAANYYSRNAKIKEIQCIRDSSINKDTNCSEYLINLESKDEYNTNKTTLLIQCGGFYEDAILIKNGCVEYILPLKNSDKWLVRPYNLYINDMANKRIDEFKKYKNIITNN